MFSAAVSYPVMTDLVVSVKKCCGCSVPLHWCGQSSRDLTVCGLTGRNLGPNPQYFAPGNRFHSSETYRRKSVTMVPELGGKKSIKNVLINLNLVFKICIPYIYIKIPKKAKAIAAA